MRVVITLLFSCVGLLPCAAQTADLPQYEGGLNAPTFSHGYVIDWYSPTNREVTVYNPDTKPAYSLPDRGDHLFYVSWSVDSDGVSARAYETLDPWGGGLELLDASGKQIASIKTDPYIPTGVVFGPDHSLWTVGVVPSHDDERDFSVIHHYSRTGEELGEMLAWSQIKGGHNAYTALQPIIGGRHFFATDDRLGLEAWLDTGHSTWIEINFSGAQLGTYDLGAYEELSYHPRAITSAGNVYAEVSHERNFRGWAVLDRSKQTWRRLSGAPKGWLIGADHDNLVFARRDGGWSVLESAPSASLRFKNSKIETASLTDQR